MPFKSEKQRKYLWANEPEIARDWTDTYGSKIHKADGGRIGFFEDGADRASGESNLLEQVLVKRRFTTFRSKQRRSSSIQAGLHIKMYIKLEQSHKHQDQNIHLIEMAL